MPLLNVVVLALSLYVLLFSSKHCLTELLAWMHIIFLNLLHHFVFPLLLQMIVLKIYYFSRFISSILFFCQHLLFAL